MPLKRIAKYSIAVISAVVCLLIGAYFYLFFVYLPRHFQQEVLPELMKDAGISGFSGKVKSAGVFGANLGELCIGDSENPALKVRSVMIQYRFQNIFMPRKPDITSLELNGVELICRIKGNKFEVNNIDIEKFVQQLTKHFSGKHKKAIGSWGNAKLRITGGLMQLDWNDTKLLLPFELVFNPEKQNWEVFTADLQFSWRDHPIKAELLVDLNNKTTGIKFNASAEMKKLTHLLSRQGVRFPGLELSGTADFKGDISFGFAPWKVLKMEVSGVSKSCGIHYGALSLTNQKRPSGLNIPLEISINSDGNDYLCRLENGLVKQPLAVFIRDLSCRVPDNKHKALEFDGMFEFDLTDLDLLKYYNIRNESRANLIRQISGRYNRITGNWQLQTAKEGKYALKTSMKPVITYGEAKFFADVSEFGFSGRGAGRSGNLIMNMLVKELSITGYKSAFFCNDLKLNSDMKLVPSSNGKMRIKKNYFKINVPEFFCSSLDQQIKVTDFSVNGSNSFDGFKMNGFELTADSKKMELKKNSDTLTGDKLNVIFDGILHRNKKTWEMVVNTTADQLYGSFRSQEFNFKNPQSRSFLSLYSPLFKWAGIKECNVRLKCDDGKFGNDEQFLEVSGVNIGTELSIDQENHLVKKIFSGKINELTAGYKGVNTSASRIELSGKYNTEQVKDENSKKSEMDFLSHFEARVVNVEHNNISYTGDSVKLSLSGNKFNSFMRPEFLKFSLLSPSLSATRDKEKFKMDEFSFKSDVVFDSLINDGKWLDALKKINAEIVYEKLSGFWRNINILTKKVDIKLNAEADSGNSHLGFEKITIDANLMNAMMYNDFWKLASRDAAMKSLGSFKDSKLSLKPDFGFRDFYVSVYDMNLRVPEVSVKTDILDKAFSGMINCEKATMSKSNSELVCDEISLKLPFGNDSEKGKINVGKVLLRKQNLGKIDAELKVSEDELTVKASHFSQVLPDASLFYIGKMKLSSDAEWEGDFTVPEFNIKNALSIGSLFPNLSSIGYTGAASLEGHLKGDLKHLKSSGKVSLKRGKLYLGSWELNRIQTTCVFSDLLNLKTMPHQKLICRSLKNGEIRFSNAFLEYQLDGFKKLDIERMSCGWFGGNLTSLVQFSLSEGNSTPEKINFLASKITLSPFLEHLGIEGFATDAFVGGIIPFAFKDNKVYISDASLATKISKIGFLRLGDGWSKYIDADDDESEISRKKFTEAVLKRFNYNWIRLNVTTSPEMAIVDLSIDGCPSEAVPFKYNSEKSVFEPAPLGDPGIKGDMVIETKFTIPKTKEVTK